MIGSKLSQRLLAKDTALNILVRLLVLSVVVGFVLRIALIFNPLTSLDGVGVMGWIKIFVCGAVNDVLIGTLLLLPLFLLLLSTGRKRFERPQFYVWLAVLVAVFLWLLFGANIIEEFNRGLHRVLIWVALWWILSFALRGFLTSIRRGWDYFWITLTIGIYTAVIIGNGISEWVFWDEFGVRYNFIAVDYLVYTSEVIGNIQQSYPMGWIISVLLVVTAIVVWLLFRRQIGDIPSLQSAGWRWPLSFGYIVAALISIVILPLMLKLQKDENKYANELQASGVYSFYNAFLSNELEYSRFYYSLPQNDLLSVEEIEGSVDIDTIGIDTLGKRNVVVITMESMSADYMRRYGRDDDRTPFLDSLYDMSLSFDRLFAAGNRTVRGLEALTLSRPPSPGESIIKRQNNTGYPSISDVLDRNGYSKMFFYGGDSYFDNMESYYSGLGFDIIDKKSFTPDEIEFETIWGICDEDVFDKMIQVISEQQKTSNGAPFLAQIMTTSNHRPYTYPEGKISIPPSAKSRKGGVMYADYALSQFFKKAAKTDWFDRTIFVVSADHCASSAGKVDLPLEAYHIPALIYAPQMIEPQLVEKVCSQVDLLPTVFALMGLEGDPQLYGRNVLSPSFGERSFMATYQDLGYLTRDTLTVLSPGEKVKQYVVTPTPDNPLHLDPITTSHASQSLLEAVSFYQE